MIQGWEERRGGCSVQGWEGRVLSSGEGVQVRQIGAGGRFIFEERMDGGRKLFLKLNYIVEPLRTTRTEWLVLYSEVPNLDCVHFI